MKKNIKLLIAAVILFIVSCATVPRASVTQLVPDPAVFMVSYPMKFSATNGLGDIIVPVGFVSDLASIPRPLWWWQGPHEATMAPAILHDYLYWEQSCTKEEADAAIYLAMLDVGMSRFSAGAVYEGVVKGGGGPWKENAKRRAQGESRFFTEAYARLLQASAVDPKATLASIQAEADKNHGMVRPTHPNLRLRAACAAWLQEFNARTGA